MEIYVTPHPYNAIKRRDWSPFSPLSSVTTVVERLQIFRDVKPAYVRKFADIPDMGVFWQGVFLVGFNCDFYRQYLDGASRESLDHIYKCLVTGEKNDAFRDVYEVE